MDFNVDDLETKITNISWAAVIIGSSLVALFVLIAYFLKDRKPVLKKPLFVGIVTAVLATTLVISGGTIYLNAKSEAGGPVHWHADFEIWACGNELELRDPRGFLSNKIGSATLHEHNDKRIHLEGVPVILDHDASLGKFMTTVGGQIDRGALVVPLNDDKYFENAPNETDGDGPADSRAADIDPFVFTGKDGKYAKFVNGQSCGGEESVVQLFAMHYDEDTKTYLQTKITNPKHYRYTPDANVPPGDCLIMEFSPDRERTDYLCKQYGVRDAERCGEFGVPEADRTRVCDIRRAED